MRTAGLIATGAVAVHELCYIVAGSAADPGAGHGYLPLVGLVSIVLLAVACAQLAAVIERARRTGRAEDAGRFRTASRDDEPPGFLSTWLLMALALTLIYFTQELLEGLVAGRHGANLPGVLAQGGSMAAPLALAVGGLLALALAGARSAVVAAARRARRTEARGGPRHACDRHEHTGPPAPRLHATSRAGPRRTSFADAARAASRAHQRPEGGPNVERTARRADRPGRRRGGGGVRGGTARR